MSGLKYVMPGGEEVRRRIEAIPDGDISVPVGSWDVVVDGRQARLGQMYQLLVAGRPVEAFGVYAPEKRHAIRLRIEGVDAVLFAVKTAKRKNERGWVLRP